MMASNNILRKCMLRDEQLQQRDLFDLKFTHMKL